MPTLTNGIYLPEIGERGWGDELNANFQALDNLIGEVESLVVEGGNSYVDKLVINVKDHGVYGSGLVDDTAAIQAVIDAAPEGAVIYFPQGVYLISAPIRVRRTLRLKGGFRVFWPSRFDPETDASLNRPAARFEVASGFAGLAAILIDDKEPLGTTRETDGVTIDTINIDGRSRTSSGSNIVGILVRGNVRSFTIRDCSIINCSGDGIETRSYTRTSTTVYTPRGGEILYNTVHSAGNLAESTQYGFRFDGFTDAVVHGNLAVDCRNGGYYFSTPGQVIFTDNTAAYNKNGAGLRLTGGDATLATGNGGMLVGNFQTDRNYGQAIYTDMVGRNDLTIVNLQSRRDGAFNDVVSTTAAIRIEGSSDSSRACPVRIIGGSTVVEDDDGNVGLFTPHRAVYIQYPKSVVFVGFQAWGQTESIVLGAGADGTNVRWEEDTTEFYTGLPTAKTRVRPTLARGKVATHPVFATAVTYTDMGSGETVWGSAGGSRLREIALDLRNAGRGRVTAQIVTSSASANNPRIYLQASPDGGTTWYTITEHLGIGTGTGGTAKASDWLSLPNEVRTDVVVRVVGIGGDGAADPSIQMVCLQIAP